MRIYVAASYTRRLTTARAAADFLRALGHEVQARWLEGEEKGDPRRFAQMDYDDLAAAQALVCLTGDNESLGGRHSELGMALALGKKIFLVGPREQVFHYLPQVQQCDDLEGLRHRLSGGCRGGNNHEKHEEHEGPGR